ncbi:hypothetical protein B8V60_07025 [Streptococcus agalactiae]|nr:hypothetical protein B8U81_05040 [Streptococcus agalactiae]KAF1105516.1 hypothetical protein B8V09_10680 [Streptococcus agalactiae]KAF1137386.1 hypothetical protein B8V14_10505 [Streptococcus agalactiae]KAF1142798.1 hypothetical protein B8V13_10020 [Streptococcus agalactiae]KAF1146878.1 hypothetical protein B8V16_03935 [Streptococcus agalactiae]
MHKTSKDIDIIGSLDYTIWYQMSQILEVIL